MTGYTVNTGSTKKFAAGWDQIFAAKKQPTGKTKRSAGTAAKSSKSKKPAKSKKSA